MGLAAGVAGLEVVVGAGEEVGCGLLAMADVERKATGLGCASLLGVWLDVVAAAEELA